MKEIKKAVAILPIEMVSFNDAMTMMRWGLDLTLIDGILYIEKGETPKDFFDKNVRILKAEDVSIAHAIEYNKWGMAVTMEEGLAIFVEE